MNNGLTSSNKEYRGPLLADKLFESNPTLIKQVNNLYFNALKA